MGNHSSLVLLMVKTICNAIIICRLVELRRLKVLLFPTVGGINRGSYMSAHVLLNLLNELRKRNKMRGLPNILCLFRNEFNKFNNTRARMLDSIYHMTLRIL